MNAKQKHKLAERLTLLLGPKFIVRYAPSYQNSEEGEGSSSNPSVGHLWYAELFNEHSIEADVNRLWMDDRKGDVETQLAAELREKAAMYLRLAQVVEQGINPPRKRENGRRAGKAVAV